MKDKKIQNSRGLVGGLFAICLTAVFGFGLVAWAVSGITNTFTGDVTINQNAGEGSLGAVSFSDGDVSNLTDLDIADEFRVQGESLLTGTTTLKTIAYASPYVLDLTVTATSTSPSGAGYVTFANDSVCQLAEVVFKGASAAGGRLGTGSPFALSAATSTAAGVGNGANIMATTTVATSTAPLLSTRQTSVNGSGLGFAGASFLVNGGEVVQFSWNGITGDPATSTDALPDSARAYLTCHSRW